MVDAAIGGSLAAGDWPPLLAGEAAGQQHLQGQRVEAMF
jgi:hypothetical protein